jgi:hypothetical protein
MNMALSVEGELAGEAEVNKALNVTGREGP